MPDAVVIVANGKGTYEYQEDQYSPSSRLVTLHAGRNLGCAGGRNLGLHYLFDNTRVERFVLLDNDTVAPADFIDRIADLDLSRLEAVAPIILDLSTNDVWSCGGTVASDGRIEQRTKVPDFQGTDSLVVDWAPGACLIIDRDTWKAVGPFDIGLDFLFEDIDWCFRLKRTGGKVVINRDMRLFHEPHQSLGGQWSQARVRLWARNGTIFRVSTLRVYPLATLKWLTTEVFLAFRDLATGRTSWGIARLHGLTQGLIAVMLR